jgi:hypothetical protein
MIATSVKPRSRFARLLAAAPASTAGPDRPRREGYCIARSDVHAQMIRQVRDEALRIMNPKLEGARGEALPALSVRARRGRAADRGWLIALLPG